MKKYIKNILKKVEEEHLQLDMENVLHNNKVNFDILNLPAIAKEDAVYIPALGDLKITMSKENFNIYKKAKELFVHIVREKEDVPFSVTIIADPTTSDYDIIQNNDYELFIITNNITSFDELLHYMYVAYDMYKDAVGEKNDYKLLRDDILES